jgi:signal transduction histidine kinase
VSSDATSGGQWFAAYRRIEPLGWTLFALAPSAGLHAEIRSAVARTAWIVLSANVVALLLALGWARQMSRPLESLTEASQRVAQGDLDARAEVLSDDDIGRVSRQFNSMVDQLRVSYTELESRVAEKTAELEKANRHKSEFLAQMSHELRTPLNAVIGFSRALDTQRKFLGSLSEKQEEYVRDIHASGLHLLALINDLLDLAKIEAGRMDLHVGVVDVPRLIDMALALVRDRADAQSVQLRAQIAPNVSTWIADERKFKQILLNLLSNAVKFTGHDGTVDVDVVLGASEPEKRPELRISVTDTGIGIPPDQVSRLFTAFGQLSQSEVTAREGTGLGLALSRRLVELHGGRIWVDSEPGHGSTFCFTLPEREWPPNLS